MVTMQKLWDSLDSYFENVKSYKKIQTSIFGESKVILEQILDAVKNKTYLIERESGNYEIAQMSMANLKAYILSDGKTRGFRVTVRYGFVVADFSGIDLGVNPILINTSHTSKFNVSLTDIEGFINEIKDGAKLYKVESFLKNIFWLKDQPDISVYELSTKEMSEIYKYHQTVNRTMLELQEDTYTKYRETHLKGFNSRVLKDFGIEIEI